MVEISSLGLSTQSAVQIRNAQESLATLSEQLSTGKKSLDLADYSFTDARRLLDFRTTISKRTAYNDVINTVLPRLNTYNNVLESLDKIGNNMMQLINTTENSSQATDAAVGSQVSSFMQQVQFFLNQQIGDRFIFSGSRYSTAPIGDLSALPVPPTDSMTPVTSPTLPSYDSAAPGSSAASYATDSATIDDGYTLNYSVSSNHAGFQQLILGMRWAYAATQDSANYSTYMDKARTLITGALTDMRDLDGQVVSNINRFNETKNLHSSFITELTGQIDDIQQADSAEVATKISFAQAQLQASYSVTAKIANLSLASYL